MVRACLPLPLLLLSDLAGQPTSCSERPAARPCVSNFRRNFWLAAVRAVNLDGLRIHDLRHTAVALWIAAGASPKKVAQRAGHTSVSFVLECYGHLFPEADTALRARPDDLFRAVTEHRRNTASLETGTAPWA